MQQTSENGSIVFIIGFKRAYGIRARLHLPLTYHVMDTNALEALKDPKGVFHNYFNSYFGLAGRTDGEDDRVEAGVFKYSGPQSHGWKTFRAGVGSVDFHGDFFSDESFKGKTHVMQLAFKPGNRSVIEFKVDGQLTKGPMSLNIPISQETFNAGGLYPKACIGMCNFGRQIRFSKITLSELEVNHDHNLTERGWVPFTRYTKHNKFTHGDHIDSDYAPFAAWTSTNR